MEQSFARMRFDWDQARAKLPSVVNLFAVFVRDHDQYCFIYPVQPVNSQKIHRMLSGETLFVVISLLVVYF